MTGSVRARLITHTRLIILLPALSGSFPTPDPSSATVHLPAHPVPLLLLLLLHTAAQASHPEPTTDQPSTRPQVGASLGSSFSLSPFVYLSHHFELLSLFSVLFLFLPPFLYPRLSRYQKSGCGKRVSLRAAVREAESS